MQRHVAQWSEVHSISVSWVIIKVHTAPKKSMDVRPIGNLLSGRETGFKGFVYSRVDLAASLHARE